MTSAHSLLFIIFASRSCNHQSDVLEDLVLSVSVFIFLRFRCYTILLYHFDLEIPDIGMSVPWIRRQDTYFLFLSMLKRPHELDLLVAYLSEQ